ncbi:MAG: tetratricopeptide repeat protein, partial [Chitinivibrionales bacterium]|nr:tetratricopeptide repeat protein [Chitinivibrionales bacterium]
ARETLSTPTAARRRKATQPEASVGRVSDVEAEEESGADESTGGRKAKAKEAADSAAEQVAAIPDHVLTPTLADIYFHQGQPALAIQIYRRLLELEPDNDRIAGRLAEIESDLEDADHEDASDDSREVPKPGAAKAKTSAKEKKSDSKPRSSKSKRGPLTGVKIKKEVRDRHRRQRRRRS